MSVITARSSVAADGAGGVGVAVVVHRHHHAVLEGLRCQGAVERNRQGFFGQPARAERGNGQVGRGAGLRKSLGAADGQQRFFVALMSRQQVRGDGQCALQGHAVGQRGDHRGERAGAQLAGRVAVGDPGQVARQHERRADGERALRPPEEQADRGHAHQAAAALAVVPRRQRPGAVAHGAQLVETGVARAAACVQRGLLQQPAVDGDVVGGGGRVFGLGMQPAQVSRAGRFEQAGSAVLAAVRPAEQQALGGEQAHLGVVRDGAEAVVGRNIAVHAARAVQRQDFIALHEFHRRAQRVADCTAEQAAAEPVSNVVHRSLSG